MIKPISLPVQDIILENIELWNQKLRDGSNNFINNRIGTSKRETSFYSEMPGPGQYSSTSRLGKAPKYSFGLKNPNSKEMFSGKDTPGPGNYNPEYKKIYKNVSYS